MKKIMIMAGGTGGHVFPGIALAEEFKKQNIETCWLGTEGGMEKEWVMQANIPFATISIKGLRGNGLKGWLFAPLNILKAFFQARKIIKKEQPDLVLGMGGFVCGPGGLATKSLGIKLAIHEQNAIPGLTNKLLAKIANLVITAFPQDKITSKNLLQIGNPVRAGLQDIAVLTAPKNQPFNILILGGSRGALALNKTLPLALSLLNKKLNFSVLHQTGVKTLTEAESFYQQAGLLEQENIKIVPFIDNMIEAYQHADLVICRSGALTVSELMAAARPAIMVPYPYAVDDHQTANAQALVAMGGGEIIQQIDLTAERLAGKIANWLLDSNIKASENIRKQASIDAHLKIVKVLKEL
ncbi:MAG TPA: undecaprenyldiphospho-muramoylpentapeptide beta-N-acetylglucosaminyltransferase [Thiomicrospira sp.]|nr:undecaprenyldiphospho-muramoylpentapeptide beta-N-acetylglucosaminyltransferase [Thiomicrospira sp.]